MTDLVVADTGPLQYLVLSDSIHILPKLARSVIVPTAVLREATHPNAPQALLNWMANPPNWIRVESTQPLRWRNALGEGESEALALALERHADVLLVDDLAARQAAAELGINSMGTLGIIAFAAEKNLLDFRQTLEKLRRTNTFLPESLITQIEARLKK